MRTLPEIKTTVSARTFGVEIEMLVKREIGVDALARMLTAGGVACAAEGYNHSTRTHWKLVTDGSVRADDGSRYGIELVSPVLSGVEGLEQIRKVCAVLAGVATVNKTCGLHVHHNASDFTAKAFTNLFRLYRMHEAELDAMVAESRRGNNNQFCRSLQGREERDVRSDRYFKLNLSAYGRHGTVEVRHHQGTVDAAKICGWVVLTQAMVERAVIRRVVNPSNNPAYNLFWAARVASWDGKTPEQKMLFKQIRTWAKVRKMALAA